MLKLACLLQLFLTKGLSSLPADTDFSHESDGEASSSLPRLSNCDYKERGQVIESEELGDLPIYVVGKGPKCIIWNYDIFGFDAGRSRELCDYFADQGYFVIMPDYFRGTWIAPPAPGTREFLVNQSNITKLMSDWEKVKAYAESHGAEHFGAIGTCWGSYPTVHFSTLPDFKAGVSMHPSHSPIMTTLGEDEEQLYQKITAKQLFMPSRTDSPNVKPGGMAENILGDKLHIIEFNEMNHGWTVRGNLSDPTIDRDVHSAIAEALDFFNENLE